MSHHYLLSYTGSPSVSVLFLRSYCTPFKALHGATPTSLTELISPYVPRRALRSADQLLLEQPTHKLKLIGLRAFSVCAPYLWNSLPFEIKSSASVSIFKAKLKTYLFRQAYFQDFQTFDFFDSQDFFYIFQCIDYNIFDTEKLIILFIIVIIIIIIITPRQLRLQRRCSSF